MNCKYVVGIDLNAKHPTWGNSRSNVNGRLLLEDLQHGIYTVHYPNSPTHYPSKRTASTLDLFLSNLYNNLSQPETLEVLDSDHYPVSMRIEAVGREKPKITRRDYNNVNWERLNQNIDRRTNENANLNTKENIANELKHFESAVQASVSENIRQIVTHANSLVIDSFTKLLIAKRNVYKRQYQRTENRNIKAYLNRLRKIISNRLVKLKNKRFDEEIAKLKEYSNPFWKITKILKNTPQQIPYLKSNDQVQMTPYEKANAIAKNIIKSHEIGSTMISPMEENVNQAITELNNNNCYLPREQEITIEEIKNITKHLKNMKEEDGGG